MADIYIYIYSLNLLKLSSAVEMLDWHLFSIQQSIICTWDIFSGRPLILLYICSFACICNTFHIFVCVSLSQTCLSVFFVAEKDREEEHFPENWKNKKIKNAFELSSIKKNYGFKRQQSRLWLEKYSRETPGQGNRHVYWGKMYASDSSTYNCEVQHISDSKMLFMY